MPGNDPEKFSHGPLRRPSRQHQAAAGAAHTPELGSGRSLIDCEHDAERRDDAVKDAIAEGELFCIAKPELDRRPYVAGEIGGRSQ